MFDYKEWQTEQSINSLTENEDIRKSLSDFFSSSFPVIIDKISSRIVRETSELADVNDPEVETKVKKSINDIAYNLISIDDLLVKMIDQFGCGEDDKIKFQVSLGKTIEESLQEVFILNGEDSKFIISQMRSLAEARKLPIKAPSKDLSPPIPFKDEPESKIPKLVPLKANKYKGPKLTKGSKSIPEPEPEIEPEPESKPEPKPSSTPFNPGTNWNVSGPLPKPPQATLKPLDAPMAQEIPPGEFPTAKVIHDAPIDINALKGIRSNKDAGNIMWKLLDQGVPAQEIYKSYPDLSRTLSSVLISRGNSEEAEKLERGYKDQNVVQRFSQWLKNRI